MGKNPQGRNQLSCSSLSSSGQQVKLGLRSRRNAATITRVEMIYPRCSLVLGTLFGRNPLV